MLFDFLFFWKKKPEPTNTFVDKVILSIEEGKWESIWLPSIATPDSYLLYLTKQGSEKFLEISAGPIGEDAINIYYMHLDRKLVPISDKNQKIISQALSRIFSYPKKEVSNVNAEIEKALAD
jgi:hypothetical protein